jgi:hypothetical protein
MFQASGFWMGGWFRQDILPIWMGASRSGDYG